MEYQQTSLRSRLRVKLRGRITGGVPSIAASNGCRVLACLGRYGGVGRNVHASFLGKGLVCQIRNSVLHIQFPPV